MASWIYTYIFISSFVWLVDLFCDLWVVNLTFGFIANQWHFAWLPSFGDVPAFKGMSLVTLWELCCSRGRRGGMCGFCSHSPSAWVRAVCLSRLECRMVTQQFSKCLIRELGGFPASWVTGISSVTWSFGGNARNKTCQWFSCIFSPITTASLDTLIITSLGLEYVKSLV